LQKTAENGYVKIAATYQNARVACRRSLDFVFEISFANLQPTATTTTEAAVTDVPQFNLEK